MASCLPRQSDRAHWESHLWKDNRVLEHCHHHHREAMLEEGTHQDRSAAVRLLPLCRWSTRAGDPCRDMLPWRRWRLVEWRGIQGSERCGTQGISEIQET